MSNLDSFRETLNRAVNAGLQATLHEAYPLLDVYRTEAAVIVQTASIDGLDPKTVRVEMNGKELTLSGTAHASGERPAEAYIRRERKFGDFSRTVTVPVPVKSTEARARVKGGVITIELPLIDDERTEVISVQTVD